MITHIVIWKYRADVEENLREEHIAMLKKLARKIRQIKSLSVGSDVLKLPRSYDTGLVATFKNRADLEAYTVHPEHIQVVDFGRNISKRVASVDFES